MTWAALPLRAGEAHARSSQAGGQGQTGGTWTDLGAIRPRSGQAAGSPWGAGSLGVGHVGALGEEAPEQWGRGVCRGAVREPGARAAGVSAGLKACAHGLRSAMAEAGGDDPRKAPLWHPCHEGRFKGAAACWGARQPGQTGSGCAEPISPESAAARSRDESGPLPGLQPQWLVSKACSACRMGLWEGRPGEVGGRAEAPSGGWL